MRRGMAERLYSAAELAREVGISKMSVLRYMEAGRLASPWRYLNYQRHRIWLWTEKELKDAVAVVRVLIRPSRGARRWRGR